MVEQLLICFGNEEALDQQQLTSLRGLLRAQGVNTLRQFLEENQRWRMAKSFSRATQQTRHGDNVGVVWLLTQIQILGPSSEELYLQHSDGCQWQSS